MRLDSYDAASRVYDIVSVLSCCGRVEEDGSLRRDTVLVVDAVGSQGAAYAEAVVPSVGESTSGRDS